MEDTVKQEKVIMEDTVKQEKVIMEDTVKFKSSKGNSYKLSNRFHNDEVGEHIEDVGYNEVLKVVKASEGSHLQNGDILLVKGAARLNNALRIFKSNQIIAYLDNA